MRNGMWRGDPRVKPEDDRKGKPENVSNGMPEYGKELMQPLEPDGSGKVCSDLR